MPVWTLGGYHIPASVARDLNKVLGIDDSSYEDLRMYWAVNNWLVDNNKLHILCQCHEWPPTRDGKPRVFFFTQFHEWYAGWKRPEVLERDEDLDVKRWLEESGATDVQWVTLDDYYGFTTGGTRPWKCDRAQIVVKTISAEEFLERSRLQREQLKESMAAWKLAQAAKEQEVFAKYYAEKEKRLGGSSSELPITAPGGGVLIVTNTLSCYEFAYLPDDFRDITRDCVTGLFSQLDTLCAHVHSLKTQAADLRTKIGTLFMFPDDTYSSLMQFSNTPNQSRPAMDYAHIDSLEMGHNLIDTIAGGNLQFHYPDFATLFFCKYPHPSSGLLRHSVHHTYVDSFAALREWCYSQYWMNDGYPQGGPSFIQYWE
ncbi:hypothetical protein BU15DRAFT_78743 [Melanogaster broomeanus]|nr:hypothetical protein BU15DRAFT_78743 [Melanogaster broomeanus]